MQAQVEQATRPERIQEIEGLVGQLLWGFIGTKDDLELAGKAARLGRLSGIWLLPTEMRSPADAATI
ncbi:MAG TPA: hypothetical protein VFA78_02705, partial [Chloroflexota bacterium]|nr:hypothetical protein [Chloroflexota bacterium]